jgi:hypothetical protein
VSSCFSGNSLGTDQKENTTTLLLLPSNSLRTDQKENTSTGKMAELVDHGENSSTCTAVNVNISQGLDVKIVL